MPFMFEVCVYGASGAGHPMSVFTLATTFSDVRATYALMDFSANAFANPRLLFIGRTARLGRQMEDHRDSGLWDRALALGATAVGVCHAGPETEQAWIEQDLLRLHAPPLNGRLHAVA
ncbi:MAG: hypothetical protein KDK12_02835 [Rhodobacteraceae bacterium]|nr:hypothetical protein [Paracoccaceae bacterium]